MVFPEVPTVPKTLARLDPVTDLHLELFEVAIHGGEAMAMVEADQDDRTPLPVQQI